MKYDGMKSNSYYAIFQDWILAWKNFVYINTRFLRRNCLKGYPHPGQIMNDPLIGDKGQVR